MIRVNLIPNERLEARRRLGRARRWVMVLTSLVVFLGVSMVVSRFVRSSDSRSVEMALEQVNQSREDGEILVRSLSHELHRTIVALNANLAVGNQPDWSIMLGLLAKYMGDDIVLRECAVTSWREETAVALPSLTEGEENAQAPVVIQLRGYGRDQRSITQFVLRMDEIPAFKTVKLVDTQLEPLLGRQRPVFRMRLEIDDTMESDAMAMEETP